MYFIFSSFKMLHRPHWQVAAFGSPKEIITDGFSPNSLVIY